MYNMIRGDFKMINFKEEVEKRKDQLIQDIETLCAIPSVYDEKTAGENLVELVEVLDSIDVTPEKIEQNATFMRDTDGNIIEY